MVRPLVFALALCALALETKAVHAADAYFVQLAAVKSEAAARAEWARMQRANPDLLGDLDLNVQSADLGDRGIFYRIRTGPFPNRTTARDMCWQIKAAKLDCLVVRGK